MKKIYCFAMAVMVAMSINAKNAFLLLESSISNLPTEESNTDAGVIAENPEQNAANWYNAQFVNKGLGQMISTSEISGAYAAGISCIWVNIDRVGLADIQAAGISDAVIADLKAFVQAGGNLLLTKQATMIAHRIGRIYAPSFTNGGYSLGGDVWAINPQLGLWPGIGQVTDHRNHPIYADVEWDNSLFGCPESLEEGAQTIYYETLPLVGANPRTDNNCMWIDLFRKDPNNPTAAMPETEGVTHYENGNILRLQEFESDWNCQMLACWGHVLDFCSAGIVDMNPDGAFQGRVMGIGFAAYQWGNSNDYIANVKKLTKNAINYMTPQGPGQGIDNTVNDAKAVKFFENGQLVILKNGVKYNALGAQL